MLNNTHLKSHNISMDEYKKLFPNALTVSSSTSEKYSKNAMQNNNDRVNHSEQTKIKISKTKKKKFESGEIEVWNKGKKLSDEHKHKVSNTRKERFISGEIIHWNTGQNLSEETKKKISDSCKGQQLTPDQKEKQQKALKEYRESENYIPSMLGKHHSEETKQRLAITSAEAQLYKTEEKQKRIRDHLYNNDIEVLSFNEHYVKCKCINCNNNFNRSYSSLVESKYKYWDGEYCPNCFPRLFTGYSYTIFDQNEILKNKDANFYVLRVYNEKEEFIKIGITKRTIEKRYKLLEAYQYEKLIIKKMKLIDAYTLEQTLLKKYKSMKYIPEISFGGHTECFNIDKISYILSDIKKEENKLFSS
jgi:hypothetical protein